ncbi:MAG: DNA ligase D, partial [Jatrophihabitantaceae bacterium]
AQVANRLQALLVEQTGCPLPQPPPPTAGRTVHWVEPRTVVEVQFANWTAEGRLRHPVFRGVRKDKRADEAVGDA